MTTYALLYNWMGEDSFDKVPAHFTFNAKDDKDAEYKVASYAHYHRGSFSRSSVNCRPATQSEIDNPFNLHNEYID